MIRKNPCLSCGACCSFFRVSFYWSESDPEVGGLVPEDLVEDISPFVCAMKGTNQAHPRCIALEGQVHEQVSCRIYELRSSACRDFGIHWSAYGISILDSAELSRCNRARNAWQLAPLFLLVPRGEVEHQILHSHKHLKPSIHHPFHLHHSDHKSAAAQM